MRLAPSATAGHSTVAVVPAPGVLVRSMRPPWLRTMLAAIGSPSPVPSPRGLVVKNGSNTACRCSGAIPDPLSPITMRTISRSAARASIVMWPPDADASQALSNRFTSTCCS